MASPLQFFDAAINQLVPNPWNSNQMTAENEKKLENSIKELGFTKPIIVRELEDGRYQILGGEHRWQVAVRLGYEQVPVVSLGMISDLKAKKIGLVDNGRYGEDDTVRLSEILREIGSADDVLSILPMTGHELDDIFAASSVDLEELDLLDDGSGMGLGELEAAKAPQTHVIMRFKVPIGDSPAVERMIETTMKSQSFTHEDSLTNAGNALVHLLMGR